MNPPDLKYSKEHEWVRLESDGVGVIGITEFATESLSDVVFLELPEVDAEIAASEKLGEVESVKAVSDIFSPVSGRVLERNDAAIESPRGRQQRPIRIGLAPEGGALRRLGVGRPDDRRAVRGVPGLARQVTPRYGKPRLRIALQPQHRFGPTPDARKDRRQLGRRAVQGHPGPASQPLCQHPRPYVRVRVAPRDRGDGQTERDAGRLRLLPGRRLVQAPHPRRGAAARQP